MTSTGWAFVTTALGVALAALAVAINRGVASGHAAVAAVLLGPSDRQRLDPGVKRFTGTVGTMSEPQRSGAPRDA